MPLARTAGVLKGTNLESPRKVQCYLVVFSCTFHQSYVHATHCVDIVHVSREHMNVAQPQTQSCCDLLPLCQRRVPSTVTKLLHASEMVRTINTKLENTKTEHIWVLRVANELVCEYNFRVCSHTFRSWFLFWVSRILSERIMTQTPSASQKFETFLLGLGTSFVLVFVL